MRYFGVLSSIILYFLLFGCVICFSRHFLHNEQSIWFNLGLIGLVGCVFYFFVIPYYKTKSSSTRWTFVFVTIIIINSSVSFLADLVEKTSERPSLPKDDFSGVFILPVGFIMTVICGWIFDRRKNRAI